MYFIAINVYLNIYYESNYIFFSVFEEKYKALRQIHFLNDNIMHFTCV